MCHGSDAALGGPDGGLADLAWVLPRTLVGFSLRWGSREGGGECPFEFQSNYWLFWVCAKTDESSVANWGGGV